MSATLELNYEGGSEVVGARSYKKRQRNARWQCQEIMNVKTR